VSAPDESAEQSGEPNDTPDERSAQQADAPSHVPPQTTRVVIAEDEALIRLDLKEMLEGRATRSSARRGTVRRRSSSPRSTGRTW
jgi:hypothetical protein